jgi:hypothetical protein
MTEHEFLSELLKGNGSVIIDKNIEWLNNAAYELYNKPTLNKNEQSKLRDIIMACNILYNRTDMSILPIKDEFYDILLEKYKTYDEHFQVGSAIVDFKNSSQNDPYNKQKEVICPIRMIKPVERNDVYQMMYEGINRPGEIFIDKKDFAEVPISFISDYISKRTHDTEHNHPSLVGTLDKCKFVFSSEAIEAGVFNDPNVKVLERDFFQDHVQKGILDPHRVINVVCELKYDGISVEADCGFQLYSARTRGDTGLGQATDITPILEGYPFKHASCMIGEKPIGVKFEAIMTKGNLQIFNQLRGKDYKNCRTAIVGLFGASDAYKYRDLITLVPLALDRDDTPYISNRLEEIEFLNKVFISHGEPLRYCFMQGTLVEILYMIKAFWDEAKIARDHLNFMYDGIVVSYVDEDIRQALGRKNYINKYSMAVKFDPLEVQTVFRGYSYEVGQNGQITPMIHYDPVCFLGTLHNKSSGSSYNRFNSLALRRGDLINVTYVNDVMPYVSKLDCEQNRENTNPVEQFPEFCPICGSKLIITDSGKSAICPSMECPGRSIQRMVNMFTKLNIKGFADASFGSMGVTHLYELYQHDERWFVDKLGVADGQRMVNELHKLRTLPIKDSLIMGSLGFTLMASKKWEIILSKITLYDLYQKYLSCTTDTQFNAILFDLTHQDVLSYTIAREFPFFEKDILEILSWNNLINSFGLTNDSKLQIRFSGIRNLQLSELLRNNGYDADDNGSVTKKTDILIIPYEGYSSNKTSKVSENCRIIPIDKFISNLDEILGESITR